MQIYFEVWHKIILQIWRRLKVREIPKPW